MSDKYNPSVDRSVARLVRQGTVDAVPRRHGRYTLFIPPWRTNQQVSLSTRLRWKHAPTHTCGQGLTTAVAFLKSLEAV